MQTISTNKSTIVLDDHGRWITAYGRAAPEGPTPHVGAKYFDIDDYKEYVWTGTAWEEIPSNPNFNEDYWDDLRFPASGFNPTGSTAPPSVSTSTGLLEFSGSADNIISGVAQMPHAWLAGSAIYPHLHLIATTSNAGKNSRWKFEYNRANNNEAFENAYGSYTAMPVLTEANPASGTKLILNPSGWGALDMTGYKESCCILWRITRLAGSDVLDDDTSVWVLAEFDIHYQVGKTGTVSRIPT